MECDIAALCAVINPSMLSGLLTGRTAYRMGRRMTNNLQFMRAAIDQNISFGKPVEFPRPRLSWYFVFPVQEIFLQLQPAAEPAKAVCSHYPVAGEDQGQGIPMHGLPYGPCAFRAA